MPVQISGLTPKRNAECKRPAMDNPLPRRRLHDPSDRLNHHGSENVEKKS